MSNLLEQASLVMIPSGYKEDVVYSQIPTDGSGDMTLTRASNGTRVNSAGLVEVCPWNLASYSEDLSNAAWTKARVTITANDTTAPNGTLTADKVSLNSGTNSKLIQQAYIQNGAFTQTVYAKAGTHNFIQLLVGSDATPYCNFDLVNGTYSASGCTASITSVGNGWFYLTMSYSTTIGTDYYLWAVDSLSSSRAVATSSTGYYYAWGFQLNIGSTAKPYFPTTDRLNVPRLTYQNGGGGCPSLLLEKQSTNVFTYSEQFDDASWVKFNSSISANTTTSPDGTSNADSLIENTGNTDHGFYKFAPTITTASGAVTISCFIKSNGRRVQIKNSYTTDASNFDLQNGVVVSNVGSGVGEIQNIGNGWYRCILKTTANASGNAGLTLSLLDNSNNMVYTGNGTSGVFVWGAQIEVSSYPTSYIPSTTSSATRVADACFKTGISSLIGQSQGTMFVDSVLTHSATTNEYLIQVSESASNRFFIYREAGTNKLGCFARVGSTTIYTQLTSGAITGRVKAVFTYQSGSFAFYVNGTQIGVSTATFSTPPTMDRLDIDSNAGAENGYYNYNEAILFKTRLTNAELQAITTI